MGHICSLSGPAVLVSWFCDWICIIILPLLTLIVHNKICTATSRVVLVHVPQGVIPTKDANNVISLAWGQEKWCFIRVRPYSNWSQRSVGGIVPQASEGVDTVAACIEIAMAAHVDLVWP